MHSWFLAATWNVYDRPTGTSVNGLNKIIVAQPTGQMIGGLFLVI